MRGPDHRRSVVGLMMTAVAVAPTYARGTPTIAGDYLCMKDCRPTDAPPNIEIDGGIALCRSELGGIYSGRLLSARSVACFDRTGVLSDDGATILWSDGAIWKRR